MLPLRTSTSLPPPFMAPLRYWAVPILLLLLLRLADGALAEINDEIAITEADFEALIAIRHAFSDPTQELKSWDETRSRACSGSWVGVKCVKGHVISLQLPGKDLGGHIAAEVGQLMALRKLNLHSNQLEGEIPSSLTYLQNLRSLYLFQNRLSGTLPSNFASPVLQALDLSANQLWGPIPSLLTLSSRLFLLDLRSNNFTGTIPQSVASLPGLRHLNLAYNSFTGPLPSHIGSLEQLRILNVSHNHLTGSVPAELGNLTALKALDLSANHFSGRLPSSLSDLRNLTRLDCSDNYFTGPVPPFFHKFNASSFMGNTGLCGYSSSVPCPATPAASPTQAAIRRKKHKFSTFILVFIIVGSVIVGILLFCLVSLILWQCGCMYVLLLLFCCCRKQEGKKQNGDRSSQPSAGEAAEVANKLVLFDGSVSFNSDDMLSATAEVLGKSTYGTVYKATLEDGSQIAVKRLREGIVRSQCDVESEVTILGTVRHPNVLPLRAYYWGSKDEKLLIYDYMAGGSLAAILHARGPNIALDWETRIRIAAGTAKGLACLHDHHKIIHGNLTSSNILLDSEMNPKVSDYGLYRLMTSAVNSNAIAAITALGYKAPELRKLRKATTKTDAYSFGIVLLELLTGKAPGEIATSEIGMDLPEWVASVAKEEWINEIFDIELMKGAVTPSNDELINTLHLALNCVSLAPGNRPEMAKVVERLEELKPDLKQIGPSTSISAM